MQNINKTPRVRGIEGKYLRGMVRTFRFPPAAEGTARLAPGPGVDPMGNDGGLAGRKMQVKDADCA